MATSEQIRAKILAYREKRQFTGLKVLNAETNFYHSWLKKEHTGLQLPNFPRVMTHSPTHKVILVGKDFKVEDLPEQKRQQVELQAVEVELDYRQFTNQEILNWFVAEAGVEGEVAYPNSFESVGHIAHFNLTNQQQPFKLVIGQITLLKCPSIKTVANKTQKLHNQFRTPTLESMGGQANYLATVKEQGVTFKFNFQEVYWCSRLQQERDRLLAVMEKGQLLADIFCGVGPLAVRAAKKGLFVIANDLNPNCHKYLVDNCKANSVSDRVMCWNMCAREAMRKIYKEKDGYEAEFRYPDHIYMNLPVDAIEFLDVLVDYSQEMGTDKMPLVHVNCFVVADSDEQSRQRLLERVKKVLPNVEDQDLVAMHHIKNVTVIMRMYCLSIRLRFNANPHEQLKKKVKEE